MDRKRDEDAGHMAVYVECEDLPPAGLTQSMHDSTVPLQLRDIVTGPAIAGGDDVGPQVSRSLIADAVRRLHPGVVGSIFTGDAADAYPTFPAIERLHPRKTKFWQFAGITANEGTIEGTYQVHDNIYLQQLGLTASATPTNLDDFSTRLYLAHGDQLTAQQIRAVQQEQAHASRAYDRRQWLCGVPAWFHIQMNLLHTVIRTHWAPALPNQSSIHCVSSDATRWGRSQNSRENIKYHLMEPIVTQGFTSRIAALFYAALQRRFLLRPQLNSTGRFEEIDEAVRSLSAAHFLDIVEEIRLAAFTQEAWLAPGVDVDFRTMCRFLQEVELFITIRTAVKQGDIGTLRRMVDPLIVVFFGASQHNYGREMLYYRWQLSSANAPELQRAILASGLVNWVGRDATFKPIDLALEHLNCYCKLDLRNFKNSTHDIEVVFQRTALCNTWIRDVRNQLEGRFGESMSGAHTTAAAIPDMFLLAWTLFVGGYAEAGRSNNLAASRVFDSVDILQAGMEVLEERVDQFNKQHVGQATASTRVPACGADDDGFEDIEAFADIVHDGYDTVNDITLDLTQVPVLDLT
jgi:hypothetical protein